MLLLTNSSFAHPGRTDRNGGHNCRTNCEKYGYSYGYHTHGSPATSSGPSNVASYKPRYDPYPAPTKTIATKSSFQRITLVGITDGDTIKVILDGKEERIRLYGIDAPEDGQTFGKASTKQLKNILANTSPSIEVKDKDKYGRLVANIWIGDRNVNQDMVRQGYAWVYRKYCNEDFCENWLRLEEQAKLDRKGLWLEKNPVPPWEWRKR